ncbi:MAG: zinc ribbon domain-containing protein [Candidatus Omnitrophica bacterium]|jgi:hypothetical protein|nr:zinc ribbon domain-containing protein [Candidatus Omnitrophota bacterium]MDX9753941.1 zinc ribbon domain-containing protein [bacterium]
MHPKKPVISESRKFLYYLGLALIALGALLFFSTFLSAALHFGDFSHFEERTRSMAFRSFGGIFLLVAGVVINRIGALGFSGSGVVLDPQQAREDLKPYSSMVGGMAKDVMEESGLVEMIQPRPTPVAEQIKVRCRACQALNDEDARFCDQCGKEL